MTHLTHSIKFTRRHIYIYILTLTLLEHTEHMLESSDIPLEPLRFVTTLICRLLLRHAGTAAPMLPRLIPNIAHSIVRSPLPSSMSTPFGNHQATGYNSRYCAPGAKPYT